MRSICCLLVFLGFASPALGSFTYARTDFAVVNAIAVPELDLPIGVGHPLCDMQFSPDGNLVYLLASCETDDRASGVYSADVYRAANGDVTGFGSFSAVFSGPEDTLFVGGLELAPGTTTPTLFTSVVQDDGSAASRGPGFTYGVLQYLDLGLEEVTELGAGYRGSGVEFLPFSGDPVTDPRTLLKMYFDTGEVWSHTATPDGDVNDDSFTVNPVGTLWADLSTSVGTNTIGDLDILTLGPLAGWAVVARYYGGVSAFQLNGTSDAPADGTTVTNVETIAFGNDAWGVEQDPVTGNIWIVSYFVPGDIPNPETETLPALVQLKSALFADGFERGDTTAW